MQDKVTSALLEIRHLNVEIQTRRHTLTALNDVNVSIARGEILGMVGESGAGKSMLGNAVIGLLPDNVSVRSGQILLEGKDIVRLSAQERNALRGAKIGAIFQDPLTSLDSLMSIGDQLMETICTHHPTISREAARQKAIALLEETGIASAQERLKQYPHQFSGGMRQRVVIALALASDPVLMIADEPTTALDVSIQAQIISLLKRLAHDRGLSVLLITHDMGVIAETADRVAVLYAGHLVEIGTVRNVIDRPQHPYTKGLMGSIPDIAASGMWLEQIDGVMPGLDQLPQGCPFHPRCRAAQTKCRTQKPELLPMGTCDAACWFASPTGKAVPDSIVKFIPRTQTRYQHG